jgi:hypothetical protein
MPKRPRRAKIFAVGRKADGKNWRARGGQAIGVGWATRGVPGIVAAKVWEIEVLAWVTVGGSGRDPALPQAIVEGSVAVGEGVPSKAPAAEAVMHVAPVLAVLQAVAVVPAEEVEEAVPVQGVVVGAVAVVVGDAGEKLCCSVCGV